MAVRFPVVRPSAVARFPAVRPVAARRSTAWAPAVRPVVAGALVAGVVVVWGVIAASAFTVRGAGTGDPPAFTRPAKAPGRPTVEPAGYGAPAPGAPRRDQAPRSGGAGRADVRVG